MKNSRDILTNKCLLAHTGLGDLVIIMYLLKELKNHRVDRVYASAYLDKLLVYFNPEVEIKLIIGVNKIPELLNLRSRPSLVHVIKNYFEFRRLYKKFVSTESTIYHHCLSVREKLLLRGPKMFTAKKKASNVYLTFANTIVDCGEIFLSSSLRAYKETKSNVVVVAPFTSDIKKDISSCFVREINELARKHNLQLVLCVHESQVEKLKNGYLDYNIKVVGTYDDLENLIASSSGVVSADTFVGHFSHYWDTKTFIVFNVKNEYWLPLRSSIDGYFCHVDDRLENLNKFLAKLY